MRSAWWEAYERNRALVREHPLFHSLVREVAIAEQPKGRPRRARLLCQTIVHDTGILPDSPDGDREAVVYVHARDNVRQRLR